MSEQAKVRRMGVSLSYEFDLVDDRGKVLDDEFSHALKRMVDDFIPRAVEAFVGSVLGAQGVMVKAPDEKGTVS